MPPFSVLQPLPNAAAALRSDFFCWKNSILIFLTRTSAFMQLPSPIHAIYPFLQVTKIIHTDPFPSAFLFASILMI